MHSKIMLKRIEGLKSLAWASLLYLGTSFFTPVFANATDQQSDPTQITQQQAPQTINQQTITNQLKTTDQQPQTKDERPHYLQGLPSREELGKMSVLDKNKLAIDQFSVDYQKKEFAWPTVISIDDSTKEKIKIFDSDVTLILTLYKDAGHGQLLHRFSGQRVEKEPILRDLKQTLEDAVILAADFYKGLDNEVYKRLKRRYGEEYKTKFADKQIPLYNLPFLDVIPPSDLIDYSNFLDKKEIYFGPTPASHISGVASMLPGHKINFNATTRRLEEIFGTPYVTAHELIHSNKKLQGWPEAFFMPAELLASGVFLESHSLFPNLVVYHGYLKRIRELSKPFFNFDFPKVEYVDGNFKFIQYDEGLLKQAIEKTSIFVPEFKRIFAEEVYPEFLSNPIFWMTVVDQFGREPVRYNHGSTEKMDENSSGRLLLLDIMMTRNYELAGKDEFLTEKRGFVDRIISDTWNSFDPDKGESLREHLRCTFNFYDVIYSLTKKNGQTSAESKREYEKDFELTYLALLKEKFLDKENNLKYDVVSLEEMADTLQGICDALDHEITNSRPIDEKYNPESKASLEKKHLVYKWYKDRLFGAAAIIKSRRLSKGEASEDDAGGATKSQNKDYEKDINFLTGRNSLFNILNPETDMMYYLPKDVKDILEIEHMFLGKRVMMGEKKETMNLTGIPNVAIKRYDIRSRCGAGEDEADIITLTRVSNYKEESKPCVILFSSKTDKFPTILMVDCDREGEPGYGLPDKVKKLYTPNLDRVFSSDKYEELLGQRKTRSLESGTEPTIIKR